MLVYNLFVFLSILALLVVVFCAIRFIKKRIIIGKCNTQKRKKRTKQIESKIANKRKKINLFEILDLARFYHIGVDDIYTRDTGKILIPGIKPNAIKAIKYYTIAGKLGYTKAYYEIGNIHEHGCGDYEGSKKDALKYYNLLYTRGLLRNNAIADKIRQLSHSVNNNRITLVDVNNRREPPVGTTHVVNNVPELVNFTEDEIIRMTQQFTENAPIIGNMYSDSQNTHDTTLNSTIRRALAEIEKQETTINTQSIPEIKEFINEYLQNTKKSNALMTLNKMEENYTKIASVDKTETEILNLIWSRIHSPENKNYQKELKENLCDYLAEAVEHGRVCCPTGRVNRVIDSLNAVDPLVNLKSTTMINQELMNKSGVIRNKLYDELSEDDKKAVDSVDDTPKSKEFADTVKNEIRTMVKDEYVKPGVLSESTATKLLSDWIDAI